VQQYQRLCELVGGLLSAPVDERRLTQSVRERGHRLVLTNVGRDLSERCGARLGTAGIAGSGEERRSPPKR
jgi:hypothetical protein